MITFTILFLFILRSIEVLGYDMRIEYVAPRAVCTDHNMISALMVKYPKNFLHYFADCKRKLALNYLCTQPERNLGQLRVDNSDEVVYFNSDFQLALSSNPNSLRNSTRDVFQLLRRSNTTATVLPVINSKPHSFALCPTQIDSRLLGEYTNNNQTDVELLSYRVYSMPDSPHLQMSLNDECLSIDIWIKHLGGDCGINESNFDDLKQQYPKNSSGPIIQTDPSKILTLDMDPSTPTEPNDKSNTKSKESHRISSSHDETLSDEDETLNTSDVNYGKQWKDIQKSEEDKPSMADVMTNPLNQKNAPKVQNGGAEVSDEVENDKFDVATQEREQEHARIKNISNSYRTHLSDRPELFWESTISPASSELKGWAPNKSNQGEQSLNGKSPTSIGSTFGEEKHRGGDSTSTIAEEEREHAKIKELAESYKPHMSEDTDKQIKFNRWSQPENEKEKKQPEIPVREELQRHNSRLKGSNGYVSNTSERGTLSAGEREREHAKVKYIAESYEPARVNTLHGSEQGSNRRGQPSSVDAMASEREHTRIKEIAESYGPSSKVKREALRGSKRNVTEHDGPDSTPGQSERVHARIKEIAESYRPHKPAEMKTSHGSEQGSNSQDQPSQTDSWINEREHARIKEIAESYGPSDKVKREALRGSKRNVTEHDGPDSTPGQSERVHARIKEIAESYRPHKPAEMKTSHGSEQGSNSQDQPSQTDSWINEREHARIKKIAESYRPLKKAKRETLRGRKRNVGENDRSILTLSRNEREHSRIKEIAESYSPKNKAKRAI